MALVVKSWHVIARLDSAKEGAAPRKVSRNFHVQQAAEQYANMLREVIRDKASVQVCGTVGDDGI